MADASYDAVVIDGGHNALTTACYLAHSGLSTAVFERGQVTWAVAPSLTNPLSLGLFAIPAPS